MAGLLTIAVGSCNQQSGSQAGGQSAASDPAPSPSTQNPTSSGSLKIAYVNNDSLSLYYDFYVAKTEELESKQRKAQRRLQDQQRKLQEAMQSFQTRAQAGLLSQNAIRQEQEKLAQMEMELKQSEITTAQGLETESIEAIKEVRQRITDFLKDYNKEKGYDVIFQHSDNPGQSAFYYANKGLDITNDVIDGLNKAYQDEQAEQ